MRVGSTRLWRALEGWSATAFFVAGGLLLASPAHIALELFVDVPLPSWLVALFILPGLLAALVGALGLYPRLVDRAPHVALAGGIAAGITAAILAVLFGWVLGGAVLAAVSGIAIGRPPDALFSAFAVTMTVGFVLFGVAALRAPGLERSLGLLLVSFAVPWLVVLAAAAVVGAPFPPWFVLAAYGPIPLIMLATGYVLRGGAVSTGRAADAVDVATG